MKSITILFVLLFIHSALHVTAQEKKEARGYLKFGYGYFLHMFKAFDENIPDPYTGLKEDYTPGGTALWIEGGYKLKNDIIISGNILYALVKKDYTDILYQGNKYMETTQNYAINFSYEFGKNSKHKFSPGLGILFNIWTVYKAEYFISTNPDGNIVITEMYVDGDPDYEMGIHLNLDYYYQFNNNFFIGARVNTVYLFTVSSLESFVFSPVIGVKF